MGGVEHNAHDAGMPAGGDELLGLPAAGGGEVHGRMWLLGGRRYEVGVLDLEVLAAVCEAGRGPQALDDADGLLEPGLALVTVDAVAGVLVAGGAPAEAGVEPSTAEQVEGGGVLGEPHRMVERRDDDRSAQPQGGGAGGDVGEQQQGRRAKAVAGEVVLGQPAAVETQLLADAEFLGDVVDNLVGGQALGPGHVGKEAEFHGVNVRVSVESAQARGPLFHRPGGAATEGGREAAFRLSK